MDYASSGVNIESGNRAVELIKESVKKTYSPFVKNDLGSFSAFFEMPPGYKQPILVSCTDGVGTKITVGIQHNQLEPLGIDLVAMCVNDLICCGAKPLFFLDYIACHQLIPEQMLALINGMSQACLQTGCSLIGGEMAEMNDLYKKGDVDLAGFSVGVVEKSELIDGKSIQAGHYVYALPSSGIHSNGFSLVRRIISQPEWEDTGMDIGTVLTPTTLYVKPIQTLLTHVTLTGIAHITGGGLAENIARILPQGVAVEIKKDAINILPIFNHLQRVGRVSESEMFKVFNMGIGMVVISPDLIEESPDIYPIGIVKNIPNGTCVTLV